MDDSLKTMLPSPLELSNQLPVTLSQRKFIAKSRDTIKRILNGTDPRLLIIVGPCSIHDPYAALEYANQLKELSYKVSDSFFLVMRCYTEKSRTSLGWKGLLYDPHLDGSYHIINGLTSTRQILLELCSLELPAAAELLNPFTAPYYSDLLSWGCIGARTTESQPHRLMASGLPMPISFKNNTSGNIESAVNGALVASLPHTFISMQNNGQMGITKTDGNPDSHITLRGGDSGPNFDPASIEYAIKSIEKAKIPLRLIIDCSHGNSRRNFYQQKEVFESILKQSIQGNKAIKGVILESHLFAGNQPLLPGKLQYAVSITDPCLDWTSTSQLILEGSNLLKEPFQTNCTRNY